MLKYQKFQSLLAECTKAHARAREEILVLAVSKGQSVEKIRALFAQGQRDFAENYLQEALSKMQELQDLPLRWHFIGHLQSNKAAKLSQCFDWVHSVDREKIAGLLNQHRPSHLPPLQICIEMNLDREQSKSGILPEDLAALASFIQEQPRLQLRGIMCHPRLLDDPQQQYKSLQRMQILFQQLQSQGFPTLDTLNMGTSQDWPAAIRAGSTMLRIGQALFGERA